MSLPRTRMSDLLGVELPIIQAGMSWASSCAELPAAVSGAGGLGVVAAGPLRPPDLREVIRAVRALTARPFAVNVPLYNKYRDEHLRTVLEERVPVLIASQGGVSRYASLFAGSGTVLLHVVAQPAHARKAVDAGAHGLIVVGAEAGGHPPGHGVSTAVLTRAVLRERLGVPVATSGGVADGFGVAAMLALGADAVQLGTRFAATVEARLHPAYKEALVAASVQDPVIVGPPGHGVRVLPNDFTAGLAHTTDPEEFARVFAGATLRQAADLGDVRGGKVEAGQTAGLVEQILPAAVVMDHLVREYHEAVGALLGTPHPQEALSP